MSEIPELTLSSLDNEFETNITELKTENVFSETEKDISEIDKLSSEEKKVILEFAEKIDIEDTQLVLQYGAPAQTKISKFSDSILQEAKSKDTGAIGADLIKLTQEIKGLDTSSNGKKSGIFSFLKPVKSKIDKMTISFNSVSDNIDNIVVSLENHQRTLMKDIHILDNMYDNNKSYFKELTMYILAGEEKLNSYTTIDIVNQKKLAETSNDPSDAQRLNDMLNMANRFEKKLHDLKLSKMLSLQMAPQIRLLQNNNSILVEKIQSSIVNAIPLWKNHIVIALGIENSKKALEAQTKVTDLTNELLLKNSELLKQGSLDIARETERSIISIETIQKNSENLISTIDEVLNIQKEGHIKRMEVEKQLTVMEEELKNSLLQATSGHIDNK